MSDVRGQRYVFIPGRRFSSKQGWPVYSVRATSSAVIGVIKPREEFSVSRVDGDYVKCLLDSGLVGWALAVLKGTRFLHPRNEEVKPRSVSPRRKAKHQVRSYGWQRARGRVKNYEEMLNKRRDQLRQVELDKHPQLLDEWMELIKELDAVLRYGFTSQVEPPKPGDNRKSRSNSFFGGGKPAAPKPKDTRKRANSFTGFFSRRPEAQPPTTATPTIDRQTQRKLLEQQRRQTQENAKRAAEMEEKMRQAAVQKARLQLMSERAKKAAASSLLPGVADTAQFSPPHKLQQRQAEPQLPHAGKLHSPDRPFFASADVPQQIPEPLAVAPARSLYRDGVTSPERAAAVTSQQPRPTADAQARQSNDLHPPPRPSHEIGGLDDEASGSGDASSDRSGSQLFEELESPREITSADMARARAVSSSDSGGSEQQAADLTAGGVDVALADAAAPALTLQRAPIMPDELSAPMSPGGDVGMAPPQPGRADFVSPNRVRHDMKRKLMQAASQQQQDQLNAMMTMFDTVADADEGKQSERAPAHESEAPVHNTQAPTTALGPGAPGSDQGSSSDAVAAVQPTGPSRDDPYSASSAAAAPPPPPELTAAPNTQPSVMITDAADVDGPVQLDNPMEVLKALETPKRKIRVSRAAARLRAAAVKGIRTQVHEAYLTAHQKAQQQKQLHHTTAHEVALELVERQREQAFAMLARQRQEEDTNRGLYTTKKHAVRTKDSILISF